MKCLDHKVKFLTHVMVKHYNWIEDASVKADLAAAKGKVQQVLKPGQVPGGSQEENEGIKKSRLIKKKCVVVVVVGGLAMSTMSNLNPSCIELGVRVGF